MEEQLFDSSDEDQIRVVKSEQLIDPTGSFQIMEALRNRGFDIDEFEIVQNKNKMAVHTKKRIIDKENMNLRNIPEISEKGDKINQIQIRVEQQNTNQCLDTMINNHEYQKCIEMIYKRLETGGTDTVYDYAMLSHWLAKCKMGLNRIEETVIELQRAKSLIMQMKQRNKTRIYAPKNNSLQEFDDNKQEILIREIQQTELAYSARMLKNKCTNMLSPAFRVFRNRSVKEVSCGDYHMLFLVESRALNSNHDIPQNWNHQVFAMGENRNGQVSNFPQNNFSEPILVHQLSGKGVIGICAFKESSTAYDNKGNVYQWGFKGIFEIERRITNIAKIEEKIKKISRGYRHYAAMTNQNNLYVWGTITDKQEIVFESKHPIKIAEQIQDILCGNNYILVRKANKQLWGMGVNRNYQLFNENNKNYNQLEMMKQRCEKMFVVNECTFIWNEGQLFLSGHYSDKKSQVMKQAEFSEDICDIISISGRIGTYYATDSKGQVYHWQVQNSGKFRKQNIPVTRCVYGSRATLCYLNTQPMVGLSEFQIINHEAKRGQTFEVLIMLKDRFGLYQLSRKDQLRLFYSTENTRTKGNIREAKFTRDGDLIHVNIEEKPGSYYLYLEWNGEWFNQTHQIVITQE